MFGILRSIWKSQQISPKTKLRFLNSNIKSFLLYGCETWKSTKTIDNRLQTFANKCLRQIMRIWWPRRISNQDLWYLTNQEPITQEIRKRKWRWIGHSLRRPNTNIARQALRWNPQGCGRRVCTPANTWSGNDGSEVLLERHLPRSQKSSSIRENGRRPMLQSKELRI